MYAWRPQVPTSVDGEPLAVSVQDLYLQFPYSRVPSGLVGWTLRPEVMILLILAYLASKPGLTSLVKAIGFNGKDSKGLVMAVAVHNLGLAAFSGIVMINSWSIVFSHLFDNGLDAIYCDRDGSLWGTGGLGAWATIFYVSKYYEFVDTWVLILKTYHHVGVVLTMWGAVVSQSAWILIVVMLNSFIHTLMYTYFFIKTLYPSMEIPSARYLTTAQICQFFTGIFYTIPLLFMGTDCDSPASLVSVVIIQLYGVGLIVLFVSFAAKKYKKNK
eukprot:scaffold1934_cov79-Cylindrotheca_fusiformis.AAC.1